jgi:hypothetical protein
MKPLLKVNQRGKRDERAIVWAGTPDAGGRRMQGDAGCRDAGRDKSGPYRNLNIFIRK